MIPLLVLRPEPGASATADRARALGLEAIVRPLFRIIPRAWHVPDPADFDCLVLTSANAIRCGGADLTRYRALPVFTVGTATASAARKAGFEHVAATDADAAAVFAYLHDHGHSRPLHLTGEDRTPYPQLPISVTTRVVYAAQPLDAQLPEPAYVALLHSSRAARHFAGLVTSREAIGIVAISPAVGDAAGTGWQTIAVADAPTDAAMLALAAELCQSDRDEA